MLGMFGFSNKDLDKIIAYDAAGLIMEKQEDWLSSTLVFKVIRPAELSSNYFLKLKLLGSCIDISDKVVVSRVGKIVTIYIITDLESGIHYDKRLYNFINNFIPYTIKTENCKLMHDVTMIPNCYRFDPNIMDISITNDLRLMFSRVTANDLDLTHWDISHIGRMTKMFVGSTIKTLNISGWKFNHEVLNEAEKVFMYARIDKIIANGIRMDFCNPNWFFDFRGSLETDNKALMKSYKTAMGENINK